MILDLTAAKGNIFSGKSVRRGGRLRSVSGGILWYLGALTLQQHQTSKKKKLFSYKVQVEEAEWEMMLKTYVSWEGKRAEVKVGNELSARTGSEPQRKPIGLGAAISIVPTHCKSLELWIVIGREGFGGGGGGADWSISEFRIWVCSLWKCKVKTLRITRFVEDGENKRSLFSGDVSRTLLQEAQNRFDFCLKAHSSILSSFFFLKWCSFNPELDFDPLLERAGILLF